MSDPTTNDMERAARGLRAIANEPPRHICYAQDCAVNAKLDSYRRVAAYLDRLAKGQPDAK